MVDVVSAPIRTGKSLYTMQLLEQAVIKNPNRFIYTNIIGCVLPGVLPAISTPDKPFDWRNLPNGSLYIHDEAHEHPAFSKIDLMKDKDLISRAPYDEYIRLINDYENLKFDEKRYLLTLLKVINQYPELPLSLKVKEKESLVRVVKDAFDENNQKRKDEVLDIGRSLTMHGHFGIEIVFITQRPNSFNEAVRAAVSQHIILRRFFKLPFAILYTYSELQESFGMMTRRNALTTRWWWYPKHLYKYYTSAESHPKSNVPKLWYAVAVLPILLMLGGWEYTKRVFGIDQEPKVVQQTNETQNSKQDQKQKQQQAFQADQLTDLCRSAVNLDRPECKKYLDELTQKGLSIAPVTVYDPAKPYDVVYQPEFKPNDFPRFKNAIVYNKKCTAYSQQGTIMHDVSSRDCFRLANGDRPFDYFAQNNQQQTQQPVDQDANYKKALYENMARLEAEKMYKSENAQVIVEQIPLGSNTRLITGSDAL